MAKRSWPCALLLVAALARAQAPQRDDLAKLRAQRNADIQEVANNASLTPDQKKEMIKGIKRGYAKRIRALQPGAPDAMAPAPDAAPTSVSASVIAVSTAAATGVEARRQLRAQRKADILTVANDKSLTLEQQKAKIAVIRQDYHDRLRAAGAPESEFAPPAVSTAPVAVSTAPVTQ